MPALDAAQIRALTDYMFVPDRVLPADVTIVLGQTRWHRPLERAISLYEAGLAGTLIFTGGFNARLDAAEAFKMQEAWVDKAYPLRHVLVDTNATNTLENMINAKRLLESNGLFRQDLSINLVSINYHMRRALETLRLVWGQEIHVGIANYPSQYCHPMHWSENDTGRQLILTEVRKIQKYLPSAFAKFNLPA